jgi:ribonucleotide reductase alpha subunit
VAREPGSAYFRAMSWFPRPAGPRALIADIRAFTAQRSRYQWAGIAVAVTMPILIIAGFYHDTTHGIAPGPQLIYAKSWPANRSDEEIKADQIKDQAKKEAQQKERQRQFQKLDNALKKVGI